MGRIGKGVLILTWLSISASTNSQVIELHHPGVVKVKNDTIRVKYSSTGFEDKISIDQVMQVAAKINKSPQHNTNLGGGSFNNGDYAYVYYDNDSIKITYNNIPYGLYYYINFESPQGKVLIRVGYQSSHGIFSENYINKYGGTTQFEIPEVYELANIIWTLSPSGRRDTTLVKTGDYISRVNTYFKPWLDHPVFKELDFPDSLRLRRYFEFRENSFTYNFKGDKIVNEGPYYYVFGNDWDNFTSPFKTLLPLVEDFAKKSNFHKFYKDNLSYYNSLIGRQKKMMALEDMWKWLEAKFPGNEYDSYKVVFSPLITGSHSTQQYWTYKNSDWFSETVMFVCGPDRFDNRKELNEKQKSGLLAGIVFTEIDHNYVNPTSDPYEKQIDSIFLPADNWVLPGVSANFYSRPMAVFNEYMTHAVFCLYVHDKYDAKEAEFIINERESLMVDRRKFHRFKEFNRNLLIYYTDNRKLTLPELYPLILNWCMENKTISSH